MHAYSGGATYDFFADFETTQQPAVHLRCITLTLHHEHGIHALRRRAYPSAADAHVGWKNGRGVEVFWCNPGEADRLSARIDIVTGDARPELDQPLPDH